MKKRNIKAIAMLSAVTLISSMPITSNAMGETTSTNVVKNEKDVLYEYGYDKEIVEAMEPNDITEISQSLTEKPDSVSKEEVVLEVDNLSQIEEFVNSSDKELINEGMSKEEIRKNRKEIEDLNNTSDADLKNKYGYNNIEVKLLREALEEDDKIKTSKEENSITASGTLNSSTLKYVQTVLQKYSNNGKNKPKHSVKITFNWSSPRFLSNKTDRIVVAWGGNQYLSSRSTSATYYSYRQKDFKYLDKEKTYGMGYTEKVVNGSAIFTAAQGKNLGTIKLKSGTASFILDQKKYQGLKTKVVSQYANVTGSKFSVSVGIGAVGISIGGTGVNKSPQASTPINI